MRPLDNLGSTPQGAPPDHEPEVRPAPGNAAERLRLAEAVRRSRDEARPVWPARASPWGPMRRPWLVALALLLPAPAAAQAPASSPVTDPYLPALMAEARAGWEARGVLAPVAEPRLTPGAACGDCWAYSPLDGFVYFARERYEAIRACRTCGSLNAELCYVAFHEEGHYVFMSGAHWAAGWLSVRGPEYMPLRCRRVADLRAAGRYP